MRHASHRARRGSGSEPPARRTPASRRVLGRILRLVLLLALLGGIALVGFGIGSGQWQLRPVLSGSMRPGLPVGGVVAVQRVPVSSLAPRDVIVFHPPGEPTVTYVHRIVWLRRVHGAVMLRTRGDDNAADDPWTIQLQGRYVYEARFALPLLGYVSVWSRSPSGRRDLLLGAGGLAGLLAIGLAMKASRDGRRRRGAPAVGPAGSAPGAPAVVAEPATLELAAPVQPAALPSGPDPTRAREVARALEVLRAFEVARAVEVVRTFQALHSLGAARRQMATHLDGRVGEEPAGPGRPAGPGPSGSEPTARTIWVSEGAGWVDDRVGYERMI